MTAPVKKQRRKVRTTRSKSRSLPSEAPPDDVAPLTKFQIRRLERSIKDLDDRTRYLIASALMPGFSFYYDVSSACYSLNRPEAATLFKRRSAAVAVQGTLRDGHSVVRCRVDEREKLVMASLPARYGKRSKRRSP
jgi:hypothetical protein